MHGQSKTECGDDLEPNVGTIGNRAGGDPRVKLGTGASRGERGGLRIDQCGLETDHVLSGQTF